MPYTGHEYRPPDCTQRDSVNDESAYRLALAQRLVPAYAGNPRVRAVIVHGSVARGRADAYSDLEISIFWQEAPSDEERRAAAERAGGRDIQLWPFYEPDGEYSGEYLVDGLHVGTGEFAVETIDSFLHDVVERYDTEVAKQILIAVIVYGFPLYGQDLVEQWRRRAAYPDGLRDAMIREHLEVDLSSLEMLARRDDLLTLYLRICAIEKAILGMLLGLNGIYLESPSFKWLRALTNEFPLAPPRLAERLSDVFRTEPLAAILELSRLVDEVYDLIEAHVPHLDITECREAALVRRQPLERTLSRHSPVAPQ